MIGIPLIQIEHASVRIFVLRKVIAQQQIFIVGFSSSGRNTLRQRLMALLSAVAVRRSYNRAGGLPDILRARLPFD
jgi:hypothetical protein